MRRKPSASVSALVSNQSVIIFLNFYQVSYRMRNFILFAFVAFLTFMPNVSYAETKIGVVDMQRILSESDAGKSIQSQIKTQREKLNTEITAMEKKLREQEQALIKQSKELTKEEFQPKKKEFEEGFIKARDEAKKKRLKAEEGMRKAIEKLQNEIAQVVAAISEERALDLVLSRNNVVVVAKPLDITADVLKGLNDKVKEIEVK